MKLEIEMLDHLLMSRTSASTGSRRRGRRPPRRRAGQQHPPRDRRARAPRLRRAHPSHRRRSLGQLRNKATTAGNLLQRTRCPIRRPQHALQQAQARLRLRGDRRVFPSARRGGVPQQSRIATYPGDMAQALRVLDANVETVKANGSTRAIPMADFHRLPGDRPELDNVLERGELITAVTLPKPIGGTHIYQKVRDRASRRLRARVRGGGRPEGRQRSRRVRRGRAQAVAGRGRRGPPCRARARHRREVFADAKPTEDNRFKISLAERTLASVLAQAKG
ncbi:FAD binding domain-containing protein [Sphingomonas sp. MMS24-JH45]